MNSASCITLSEPAVPGGAARGGRNCVLAAALCALLAGCGGTKAPDPAPAPSGRASSSAPKDEPRIGSLTFHYANKSTDANMSLDLGAEDVYLDMSGKPVKPEEATPIRRREAQEGSRAQDAEAPPPERALPAASSGAASPAPVPVRPGPETAPPPLPSGPRPAQPRSESKPDRFPENDEGSYAPDVTDKVTSGIRKAQEFFYQKRYNEALDMVRASLDARPTAEAHALAGSIHYMLGQSGLAKRHWQEALRLNPDMPAVVNMLEKISTPGGRGSPFPRPLATRRAAPAPAADVIEASKPPVEAPYPEEYGLEAGKTAPAPATPPAPAPPPESHPKGDGK